MSNILLHWLNPYIGPQGDIIPQLQKKILRFREIK